MRFYEGFPVHSGLCFVAFLTQQSCGPAFNDSKEDKVHNPRFWCGFCSNTKAASLSFYSSSSSTATARNSSRKQEIPYLLPAHTHHSNYLLSKLFFLSKSKASAGCCYCHQGRISRVAFTSLIKIKGLLNAETSKLCEQPAVALFSQASEWGLKRWKELIMVH